MSQEFCDQKYGVKHRDISGAFYAQILTFGIYFPKKALSNSAQSCGFEFLFEVNNCPVNATKHLLAPKTKLKNMFEKY